MEMDVFSVKLNEISGIDSEPSFWSMVDLFMYTEGFLVVA